MIHALLALSVRARWMVIALTVIVAGFGAWQLTRLPVDATPDITTKQVQINTTVPALGPAEVEKRVTFPIETALAGLAGVESTRSFSRNGFSQVTAVLDESANLYFMRQQVAERLSQVHAGLPGDAQPQLGPVTTGLGEVFHYSVDFAPKGKTVDGRPGWQSDGSFLTDDGERLADEVSRLAYLRTVQDWIIRPQLRTTPGVADIDSLGGYVKQYVVEPDPVKLAGYGLSYTELAEALEKANLSVGANFIQRGGESYLVRADARIQSLDEIARAVVAVRGGVPIAVRDVAAVQVGGELRVGSASRDGHEQVIGAGMMLVGENSRTVAHALREKLEAISKTLPTGVFAEPVLDRSQLVMSTISTVARNLGEGALLVVATLFLLLGNWRAAVIATLVIPLSMLMSATGMNALHISGNLMSLGALDFGLIIDGAVIIVENALRRIAARQHALGRELAKPERLQEIVQASREMVGPTVYGQIVIFLVFAPCLAFQGVEGKMFSPMVITLMLALASAFVLSLTFVPAMAALMLTGRVDEAEAPIIARTKTAYAPWLHRVVARPWPVIGLGVGLFAAAVIVFGFLGREFMPTLDEQNLNLSSVRVPSTSVDQSSALDLKIENALKTLPEVKTVYSKVGTASLAADPMPPNASDNYIILKPKTEWPKGVRTKDEVIKRIRARIDGILGNAYDVTQPIEMRFNELIGGVRSDVAIKLYGDDLDQLTTTGDAIAKVLARVPGAVDVRSAQTRGFPTFEIDFDREAISRYGLNIQEVADTVATAMGGRTAGQLFDGDRRFDIVVRTGDAQRSDLDAIGALPVMLPGAGNGPRASVPLRQLATFRFTEGLNEISRDNGKRRIYVQANVRDRDIGSFAAEAQKRIAAEVKLPAGSWLEWGGQFQNLQAAVSRLTLIVPVCFALIFGVLWVALGGARLAGAVFSAVPLALAGGVFALALRGIPFSVSAAVGFIAVSGVAVLNGLVLITSIRRRFLDGQPLEAAIVDGTLERVRPVLMTALVASLGFVPMALATGPGAEVQKPLATVVIGGLISSTALTLFVLPAIARLVMRRSPAPAGEGVLARAE
jgi:cobalt-zinc-cadmium resistance protein CzcA